MVVPNVRFTEGICVPQQVFASDPPNAEEVDIDKLCAAAEKLSEAFDRLWSDFSNEDQAQSSDYESGSSLERRKVDDATDRPRRVSNKSLRKKSDRSKAVARPTTLMENEEWDPISTEKILNRLMKHRHAWPFLKPVDPVELQLEDYFEVSLQFSSE